jgi:SAM-dependent methyltransferase
MGCQRSNAGLTGTWHHGLVAEWWALFNRDGPEIEYFGRHVADGQPALDAGCGTGRLLIPWLRAGHDVDGCDASADMIARCRERADEEGLEPVLFVQALHELAPPRRYRTIVVCGVFGLGSTREQDMEALRRMHAALEPGGTLVIDNEVPYADADYWALWPAGSRTALPEAERSPGERVPAPDGSERALRSRVLAMDPLDQSITLEIAADKWVDGEHVVHETHRLSMRGYFHHELMLMLAGAGFEVVEVHADHAEQPPTAESRFLVYVCRRRDAGRLPGS